MQNPRTYTATVNKQALRMAMQFHRMSNADLARAAGVSKGTIGNLLGPTRKSFNPETAAKVAAALRTDTSDLFTLTPCTVEPTPHGPSRRTAA